MAESPAGVTGSRPQQARAGKNSWLWPVRSMTLDSSAILAVLFREDGFESPVDSMLAAQVRIVGAPTLVETGIVLSTKLGANAQGLLDRFMQVFGVSTVAFGEAHWREACEAFLRFG